MHSRTSFATPAIVTLMGLAAAASAARADNPKSTEEPRPVPVTRRALKESLEGSKKSQPRLPLPPLSPGEVKKAAEGDWSVVNNGRMRNYYLPVEFRPAGLGRGPDPEMSLSYPFSVMHFWIVSRVNNCTYCLGHQESKLSAAGVDEATIAALDGDRSEFTEAERASFDFTRKLTAEPQAIRAEDIDHLRTYYKDSQILELLMLDGNYNAMNRWTGALAIPQEEHRVYLTPTAAKFVDRPSTLAPAAPTSARGPALPSRRGPLESRAEVEAALSTARSRSSRLPLVAEAEARAVLPAAFATGPIPEYARLLARFPKGGVQRVLVHQAAETKGLLEPRLKAEIAYACARHDRAWYALGHARARLKALGMSDDAIEALDAPGSQLPETERLAVDFARKLTVDTARISDADVERLRARFSDRETAEVIWLATEAAFFDRVTEAAGLRLED